MWRRPPRPPRCTGSRPPGPRSGCKRFPVRFRIRTVGRFGGKRRPHPRCIERLAQGPDGLGSGRHPHGLLGQDDRYLGVAGELELALGGQDLGLRGVGVGHRLIPRHQGQRPQAQGHDGHGDAGGQHPSAPTGVRLAAGQDVLDLEGGRCRIGQLGRSGQPVLGRPQFTSSEEQAPISPLGIPLQALGQPAGVLLSDLQVGVEGPDHPLDRCVEVVVSGERNPVTVTNLLGRIVIRDGDVEDGDDPLLELQGVGDLLVAVGRSDRVRGDHEQECIRTFDRRSDGLGEHLCVGDALGVQPGPLARTSRDAAIRCTNSESRREYEMNTSAIDIRLDHLTCSRSSSLGHCSQAGR